MKCTPESVALELLAYCKANDWAGYDPYDALNSRLFNAIPLLDSRVPRIAITQLLKRSPINLRGLLGIPKTQNPKALGLFLSAFVNMSKARVACELPIDKLIELIATRRSANQHYSCWGYSFPWQTRTILVPAGSPNLVCTVFAANALLDAYEAPLGGPECLEMAASAAEYIHDKLFWRDGPNLGFSYPLPEVHAQVHNANFLAGALLSRVASHTGQDNLRNLGLEVARYSALKQQSDGSWVYGELPTQNWIDNFHTGFNLCALRDIRRFADTDEFDSCIERGFKFYRDNFFLSSGAPKYFHNRAYPIDIHSVAQSIITLQTFGEVDPGNQQVARSVFDWAIDHMWDHRGFFYYRVNRYWTDRTSYMRWSQAWMLLALSTLAIRSSNVLEPIQAQPSTLSVIGR